jgi:hypothetical protein
MQPARWLIIAGLLLVVVGLLWLGADKLGIGRLPGDLIVKRKGFTLYIPIVSSLVVSLVLTLLLRFFGRK